MSRIVLAGSNGTHALGYLNDTILKMDNLEELFSSNHSTLQEDSNNLNFIVSITLHMMCIWFQSPFRQKHMPTTTVEEVARLLDVYHCHFYFRFVFYHPGHDVNSTHGHPVQTCLRLPNTAL